MDSHQSTTLALGIDFSSTALHCAYGTPGSTPYRLKLPIHSMVHEDRVIEAHEQTSKFLDIVEKNWPNLETSVMVIERPFLGHSVKTLVVLSAIQTAVILTAHLRSWYPVQEDPNVIRKQILGKGTSSKKGEIKELAKQYVLDQWGWEVGPDEADALVIWRYAEWLVVGSTRSSVAS